MHNNEISLLHIYGQHIYHDDAYIIGNQQALESLRDAIGSALSNGKADIQLFTSDGEGYHVKILLNNEEWLREFWRHLALPYIDEMASEKRENAVWPWQLPRLKGGKQ